MSDERNVQSERKPYNKYARSPRPEEKKINVEQVVTYLSHAFARAQQKAVYALGGNRNHKGSKLYDFQVGFCYLIDEIQRGPVYILPKVIQDANQLILELERISVPASDEVLKVE